MLLQSNNIEIINKLSEESKYLYSNFSNTYDLLPLTICIFLIGFVGFLESKDFLALLVNIELMMMGINFYLITCSIISGTHLGQLYALCFLAITAAETAVGLGLLILLYRSKGQISFTELSSLKG
jgi:NADH-quinone oxidoreductase subunit K